MESESSASLLLYISDLYSGMTKNANLYGKKMILQETDLDILTRWVKLAARVDSLDQFIKEM